MGVKWTKIVLKTKKQKSQKIYECYGTIMKLKNRDDKIFLCVLILMVVIKYTTSELY